MAEFDRLPARMLDLRIARDRRDRARVREADAALARQAMEAEWRVVHSDVLDLLRWHPDVAGRELANSFVFRDGTDDLWVVLHGELTQVVPLDMVALPPPPTETADAWVMAAWAKAVAEAERERDDAPPEPAVDVPTHISPAEFSWTPDGMRARQAAREFAASLEDAPPETIGPPAETADAAKARIAAALDEALRKGLPELEGEPDPDLYL